MNNHRGILQTARKVLETSMGVKPGESILIITDSVTSPLIGQAFFNAASAMGCEVMLVNMLPRAHSGMEPPRAIAEAMKNVDVVIAPTSKSLSHTKARMKCGCGGARMTTMPGITEDMMVSGGMTADYEKVSKLVLDSRSLLSSAKEIRITTNSGTDIVFDVRGCKWKADTSELGPLKSPLEITVENRYVSEIKGERADELKTILEGVGKLAYNLAELGFGLNPVARMIGNALEDEKVGGTIHIGLGDSSTIGGDVVAGIHLDAIITKPKVFADDKEVKIGAFDKYS
ncbi:MAG: hypothetical protein O8C59_04875 [Candidatus Methanoperedens sp.]|nr:hypothetical protein [Candidatus Methanoperedens sp.]